MPNPHNQAPSNPAWSQPPPPVGRPVPPPPPPRSLVGNHSPHPQPPPREPYDLKRTFGRIAWVATTVVLGLAVWAFVAGRGFSLSASENGPSVRVDAALAGAASAEQIDESQSKLEAELAEANEQIADEAPAATSVDIAGEWFGETSGASYLIEQNGTAATITELDMFGNITAVGRGTLSGDTFSFDYDSAAGTTGFGELTLDVSNQFLNGFWEDAFGRRLAQLSRL